MNNQDKIRESHVKRKYNLSRAEHVAILEQQNYMCAFKGCAKTVTWQGRGSAIDHDPITSFVRGIPCTQHNVGLGLLDGPSKEPPDDEGWGENYNISCGYCQHPGRYHKFYSGHCYTGAGYCLVEGCFDFTGHRQCQGFSRIITKELKRLYKKEQNFNAKVNKSKWEW